jgi:small-conductance mechanosensitive channel
MAETYLFYSSLTLFAMSCLTLVLFVSFRLKYHRISSLPKNLSANVFDKTFNVLDPYPERRKIIHSFLSAVPLIAFFACLAFVILLWKVFEYGLLSSFFILIVCLNLMLTEVASETYQTTEILIKAVRKRADLATGDIKAFQTLKNALPKLSNYYLALSILFFVFAAMLGYIWSSLLLFFSQVIGLILEVSAATGIIAYQVAVLIFALIVVLIQIFAWKIKNKFLRHLVE